MDTLKTIWNDIFRTVLTMNVPVDVVDILIVTFLLYQVFKLVRSHTGGQIIKTVIFLLAVSYLSGAIGLNALNFIVNNIIEVGLIALVVVFQPELRRILERIGSSSFKGLLTHKVQQEDMGEVVAQTVAACRAMSRQKIGALIVFERENSLEEYFKTGTVVDGLVSTELYKNIFFPNAALHDGAVVVRKDRILAAGCVLPLTEKPNLSRELGTRHRAAIGISEHSDAVVVVVSEETGVISCSIGGELKRYLTPENLTKTLREELIRDEKPPVQNKLQELVNVFKKEKSEGGHED